MFYTMPAVFYSEIVFLSSAPQIALTVSVSCGHKRVVIDWTWFSRGSVFIYASHPVVHHKTYVDCLQTIVFWILEYDALDKLNGMTCET